MTIPLTPLTGGEMTVKVRPFVHGSEQDRRIYDAVADLLEAIGEDPEREGLKETPLRVMRFWKELLGTPKPTLTTFEAEGPITTPIVQGGIPFYSLCEHHLLPFFGSAVVAYLPDTRIVGLSKLARVVQYHAAGPRNQERITRLAAEHLYQHAGLNPRAVGVSIEARHLCMEMRGVKAHDTTTSTMHLCGVDPQEVQDIKIALEAYQRGL